ncbi:MAG: nucleoside 2-deoxyribosyltransferase domain-containing protein [Geminicoccaceae bacterium]
MEIKAPNPIPPHKGAVFLAGSIEMGTAEDWQAKAADELSSKGWVVLNPRRDDWDVSWEQSIKNPQFREQVEWELAALDLSEAAILYFSPGTKSPISLLELGLFADSGKLLVVCPEGFWRKGNVDIVCRKFDIPQFNSVSDAIVALAA